MLNIIDIFTTLVFFSGAFKKIFKKKTKVRVFSGEFSIP